MELTTSWQRVAEATQKVGTSNVYANTRFYLKRSASDITNNRHTIYWEFRVASSPDKDWATYGYGFTKTFSIYDGSTARASGSFKEGTYPSDLITPTERVLASGSWTQGHNSDGSWSSTLTFNGHVYGVAYTRYVDVSLPTIPRQANILTAQDFNDEENPTITYENKAGNSVSSLQACISLTGSADDIKYRDIPKTGTLSYTFELTEEERKILRQATTTNNRKLFFYIRTDIGGKSYYSPLEKTFTIINADPEFNDFEFKDTNPKTVALTGNDQSVILGYSNIEVTIPVTNKAIAKKEATMVNYRFNNKDGAYSETEPVVIDGGIATAGEFTVYAIDSRQNSKNKIKLAKEAISYTPITKTKDLVAKRENGVSESVQISFAGKADLKVFGKTLRNIQIGDDLSEKTIYCKFPDNLGNELLYDEYGKIDDIQFITCYDSSQGLLTGYMTSGLFYRTSGLDYQFVQVKDDYIYNNDPNHETITNLTEYKLQDDFGVVTDIDTTSSAYKYIFIEESGETNTIKQAKYRYTVAGKQEWSEYANLDLQINDDGEFSFNGLIAGDIPNVGFDINNSYNIEVYIEDELSKIVYSANLSSGTPHIAYAKNGVGIMGKYDERVGGLLQVGGQRIDNLSGGGEDTLPIGAIVEYDGNSVPDGYEEVEEDSGWLDLVFPNTSLFEQYNNFQTCQYRKIGDKLVFRGMINVVTAKNESTDVVCKMQNADFAPSKNRYVTIASAGGEYNYGGYPLNAIITKQGEITMNYCKVQSWMSLDGLEIYL